jgi:hypothetical protein
MAIEDVDREIDWPVNYQNEDYWDYLNKKKPQLVSVKEVKSVNNG